MGIKPAPGPCSKCWLFVADTVRSPPGSPWAPSQLLFSSILAPLPEGLPCSTLLCPHPQHGLHPCPAALTSDRQELGYHTCSVYGRACSTLSLRVHQCVHLQLPAVVICHCLPVSFLYPPAWDHLPKKTHLISNPCLRVCFWETQTRTSLKPALQGCVRDSTFFLPNVYYIPGAGFGDPSLRKEQRLTGL